MKRPSKTIISTKVEANKDKIYRCSDVYDLAGLVFPHKNAVDLRAGFILIFLAIKYAEGSRISMIELENFRRAKAKEISCKSLWKVRATMVRLGLITKRDGLWQFSTKFSKAMANLSEKAASLMKFDDDRQQKEKEWFLLDCALGKKN